VHPSAYIGVDLGTSGCRAVAVDRTGREIARAVRPLPPPIRSADGRSVQDPRLWWDAVEAVLGRLAAELAGHRIRAVAVDGTSATLLLADEHGSPLGPALMYDDRRGAGALGRIGACAPADTAVHSASSSLAKLAHLVATPAASRARFALHQADWILARLTGQAGVGDENNALKLGYDAAQRCWPDWIRDPRLGIPPAWLPRVVPAGTAIGPIRPGLARRLGLPEATQAVAGTTDSTAAALAAGVRGPGDAVTSLGSTLVVKVVSPHPAFCADSGVYSHRLGGLWLAGGASNSGGAVLEAFFTRDQMTQMEPRLDPARPTGLDYYPLLRPGERFPDNDPDKAPRIDPRPGDPVRFFQALLEGMAEIERRGYERLRALGTPPPRRILSIGGGARNPAWRAIRERLIGVPVIEAPRQEAAYGSALLALAGAESLTPEALSELIQ
jgi:hypothetical protein